MIVGHSSALVVATRSSFEARMLLGVVEEVLGLGASGRMQGAPGQRSGVLGRHGTQEQQLQTC